MDHLHHNGLDLKAFILICLAVSVAVGQQQTTGTVTYVAAGQVYVGAGRSKGIADSATATVVRGTTLITTLRLVAASSSSSSWTADSAVQSVQVGDQVRIRFTPAQDVAVVPVDTLPRTPAKTMLTTDYRRPSRASTSPAIDLVGRIGTQLVVLGFDQPSQNLRQAGVVVSARARLRDLPLRFELYANGRDVSRGSVRPLSARSMNASRLYRAAIEYDDTRNQAAIGRMTLPFAPTVGVLDGATYARRWGSLTTGLGIGFQPDLNLQGADFLRRRFIIFANLQPASMPSASLSGTYAKTWYKGASEREVVNATGSTAISDRISIWGSTDIDLRVSEAGVHRLAPSLSLLLVTASWRVNDVFSLSGGLDASRSVLPFSFARFIPDSMTDHSLRSGLSISGSLSLRRGMSVTATLTPRLTAGAFNGDYAASTSVGAYDLFGSGVGLRLQGTLNQSQMSIGQGLGLTASMNALTVDWNLRVQQVQYRLRSSAPGSTGTTVGLDAMVPILRRLSWLVSFDAVHGFSASSRSLFTELTYRF